MIRILAFILTIAGIVGLVLGVLGIFGNNFVTLSPWAMTILGFVFFLAGVSMLKYRKDTPVTE